MLAVRNISKISPVHICSNKSFFLLLFSKWLDESLNQIMNNKWCVLMFMWILAISSSGLCTNPNTLIFYTSINPLVLFVVVRILIFCWDLKTALYSAQVEILKAYWGYLVRRMCLHYLNIFRVCFYGHFGSFIDRFVWL